MSMKTLAGYYPYDRLALVVDESDFRVLQLVWLSSRWGVYSYSGGKWNEEITKQFLIKGRLYAHLDASCFWEILSKFNDAQAIMYLEEFQEYQVTYEFEFHEFFDLSLSDDGLRDAYEISRWVNEFNEPSPVEIAGETCDRSKYYSHYVAEIVEPEKRRMAYEAEILRRRKIDIRERVQYKLYWIEGFPTLNHYAVDIYNHSEDRHQLQMVGQDYEDGWQYKTRRVEFVKYMYGESLMSIAEIESVSAYFLRDLIGSFDPLPTEIVNIISRKNE